MAHVAVSKRYDLPATEMWARIGDPGALATWHPGVETTELIDGGRTRVNTIPGGARVVEPILEQTDHSYTFRITDSPLPLSDYVSTIQARGDGDRACTVEWEATFEPNGVTEADAADLIRGFFQAGLDAL